MSAEGVPFVDLVAVHREVEEELVQAFRRCLETAVFVGGPEVESFEREFAAYCGAAHCVGLASGTDAVRFALMAAGVGPGDAVVTVAHTFIATVEAIGQAGAATEFVDVDERTGTMSPAALADYLEGCAVDRVSGRPLGRRTGLPIRAILPVHLYGRMADMDPLMEIAERYGLDVIEDACQAHGAEYLTRRGGAAAWKRAGTFGKAAAFSFYPGKNLGACGEAGAVTTADVEIADRIRLLRDHGQGRKYHHVVEGFNGRLDAIQAALLRVKLRSLDAGNMQRRAAADSYRELLQELQAGIVLPFEDSSLNRSVHHLYVIRTASRDALQRHLQERGVGTGLHYPIPVHLQPCYSGWGYGPGALPVTERAAREVLSLPMFPSITRLQQERVAAALRAFMAVPAE